MRIIAIPVVKDMFDNCRVISDFFNNSPKRFEKFSEIIETLMPGTTAFKLINICKTRGIQRIKGVSRFHEAYKATYVTLAKIRDNDIFNGSEWNTETRATAAGLYKCMRKLDSIVALVVCKEVMENVSSLTVCLQSSTLAVVEAYESVSTVIETLEAMRISVTKYHEKWYNDDVTSRRYTKYALNMRYPNSQNKYPSIKYYICFTHNIISCWYTSLSLFTSQTSNIYIKMLMM